MIWPAGFSIVKIRAASFVKIGSCGTALFFHDKPCSVVAGKTVISRRTIIKFRYLISVCWVMLAGSICAPVVSFNATVPGPGTLPKKAPSAFLLKIEAINISTPVEPISFRNILLSKSNFLANFLSEITSPSNTFPFSFFQILCRS